MKSEKTCVEREELWALAHQMLEARDESRVRAHVATCPACRKMLEGYHQLDAALDEWKPSEPSPWFDARVRAAVAKARPARGGWFSREWVRWLAPALTVLVIVAGLAILRSERGRRAGDTERQASSTVAPATNNPAAAQVRAADQELSMYENLPVLEDYDMLSSADVLSELPKAAGKDGNVAD